MRVNRYPILLLLMLLTAVAILMLANRRKAGSVPEAYSALSNIAPSGPIGPQGAASALVSQARARREALAEWRTPIEFYGTVVDQNLIPVPDASVYFSCNDLSATGTSEYKTVSDQDGRFSLTGVTGKFLSVRVTKNGFIPGNPYAIGFFYAGGDTNHLPKKDAPVVFKLFRRGLSQEASESPEVTTKLVHVAPGADGTQLVLWPRQTERDFSVNATMSRQAGIDSRFQWKLTLNGNSGAQLCSITEANRYLAPEDGYSESVSVEMNPQGPEPWEGIITREFFVKQDGIFAKLWLRFTVDTGALRFRAYVNPGGSRSFENTVR